MGSQKKLRNKECPLCSSKLKYKHCCELKAKEARRKFVKDARDSLPNASTLVEQQLLNKSKINIIWRYKGDNEIESEKSSEAANNAMAKIKRDGLLKPKNGVYLPN